jgi:hypothetical protein
MEKTGINVGCIKYINSHTMKKSLLLLSILLMSVIYSHAQQPNIFLYETDTGYTYVDKNFKPVINKTFKFAGRFFEGLAVASKNGYAGYINPQGTFVIKPDYEYALPFHNGVAKVWKDGKPYQQKRTNSFQPYNCK